MLGTRILKIFRPPGMAPTNGGPGLAADYARIERAARSAGPVEMDRQSNGLRQFFENLRGETRLHILDLGGVSQANVNFVTLRGHKLYTGDLLVGLDRVGVAPREPGKAAGPTARFIKENLNFPPAHFDGILVWDSLEFLDEEMLWAAVSSLQAILKPGGCLLSFFHTHAKGETVHIYRYQIRDHQTLHLQPRCSRPLPRAFNNRNLERLFGNFHAVKFFLAKDNLREVIVTR